MAKKSVSMPPPPASAKGTQAPPVKMPEPPASAKGTSATMKSRKPPKGY